MLALGRVASPSHLTSPLLGSVLALRPFLSFASTNCRAVVLLFYVLAGAITANITFKYNHVYFITECLAPALNNVEPEAFCDGELPRSLTVLAAWVVGMVVVLAGALSTTLRVIPQTLAPRVGIVAVFVSLSIGIVFTEAGQDNFTTALSLPFGIIIGSALLRAVFASYFSLVFAPDSMGRVFALVSILAQTASMFVWLAWRRYVCSDSTLHD